MLKRLATLAIAGAMTLGLVTAAPAAQGSGCMPTTGTISGLAFAQAVNAALAAFISGNSGASEPATDCTGTPIKGQTWLDTSVTPNVERRFDGTNWVAVGAIDSANHLWSPPVGGGTAAITAASTTDLCAAPSAFQTVTGTTTITSFGSTCVVGTRKTLLFNSATPITYNATSMILPGQRSYTASAGDMADVLYLGSGNWRVLISKIDGGSVTNPAIPLGTYIYGTFGTIPPKSLYGVGQAISRASYPDYLAAVTRAQTGTITAGNNTITSVGNTSGLGAGMPIEGTGIQAGTTISSVTSSTIVMSANATGNGSQTVTAFLTGYGSGGDSTTVGVKDCRGKVVAGRDNPIAAAGTLTSATVIGTSLGAEFKTISRGNLPVVTLDVNIGAGQGSHSHADQTTAGPAGANPALNAAGDGGQAFLSHSTAPALLPAMTGTASLGGSGTPLSVLQPTLVLECVVFVLP